MNIAEINSSCIYSSNNVSSVNETLDKSINASILNGNNIDVDTIVERMDFENSKARDASRHLLFLNSLNKIAKLYESTQADQANALKDIADLEEKNAKIEEELHNLINDEKLLKLEYSSLKNIIDNMKPDDEEIELKKKRLEELAKKKLELSQKIEDDEAIALDNANTILSLIGKLNTSTLKALVETAMLTLGEVNKMAWNNPIFDKNIYKEDIQPIVDALEDIQKKIQDEQMDKIIEEVSKQTI